MDILAGVVICVLVAWLIMIVPIAGAMAGLEERQKHQVPPRVVLDRDAPLEHSEREPHAAIGALMDELARDGARQLGERSS